MWWESFKTTYVMSSDVFMSVPSLEPRTCALEDNNKTFRKGQEKQKNSTL